MNRDDEGNADTLVRSFGTGRTAFRTRVSALLLLFTAPSMAHNPDTSYLRCLVEPHGLELRFTFDPATLHCIVRPDVDGDGKITRAELEAVAPVIFDYLEATIRLEIKGKPEKLGERVGLGWPVEAGEAIAEKDYHTQLLHFTFQCRSQPLIEDVYACYEVFAELGDRHRVIADIVQGEKHQEVVFNQFEPDYLYDTFWREDANVQRKATFHAGAVIIWQNQILLSALLAVMLLTSRLSSRIVSSALAVVLVAGVTVIRLGGDMRWETWQTVGAGVGALSAVIVLLPVRLLFALGRSGGQGGKP